MENIIRFKKYEMKSKTYIKYMLSITLVILFLSLNIINFLDTKKINNLPIVQDINSINVILGLISIPTCLLYYYMYKNNEFFILKLSYISIFIEYIFVNYINSNTAKNENHDFTQIITTDDGDNYYRKAGISFFMKRLNSYTKTIDLKSLDANK